MIKIFDGYPPINIYVIESKKELEEIFIDILEKRIIKIKEQEVREAFENAIKYVG